MTYRGHLENGVVVFDEPAPLPEGAKVRVEPVEESKSLPLGKALLRFSGVVSDLPSDMAKNHDHYLHGRPRR